jgi:hypothetical protein
MQQNGIRADQITQVRGFADQRLLTPETPLDPSNRRISLIVLYRDDANDAAAAGGAGDSSGVPVPTGKDADQTAKGANDAAAAPTSPQVGPHEPGAERKAGAKKNGGTSPPASAADKKASSTMTMEEIRRAVEKMNGKTAPPAAGAKPAAPDKEKKDKPQ